MATPSLNQLDNMEHTGIIRGSIKPNPPHPETAIGPEKEPAPSILGNVKVKKDDFLATMIRTFYGAYSPDILASVIAANQNIKNPNHIIVGQTIRFPALSVQPVFTENNACWVEVAKKQNLEDAYRFLRTYPVEAPPICLVPYWNMDEGLNFSVLYKQGFKDEETARISLANLPDAFSSDAQVISKWSEDTVFFSRSLR
jgi:hypothetical protein